jgi:diguanylate cyclase (GGDEF)-like protein
MLEQEHLIARNASVAAALEHATELRAHAATERAQAAEDRRLAALDRLRAAEERVEAVKALTAAELDDLTGVYRRGIGEQALKAEIERARQDGSPLVLAILDVQGLKEVNDEHGHLAGDRLLCDVVASIQMNIRSYEPIVRVGGDEFAFTIAGLDWEAASERISMMRAELARRPSRGRFWIGLTNVLPDDSLGDAMARADAALIHAGGADGDRPH